MTSIETLALKAVRALSQGNDDAGTDALVDLFNEANRNPEQFSQVGLHADVGNAFLMMLVQGISSDEDSQQQIASISYLFLTKAIERNPGQLNLVQNRLLLLENTNSVFRWTVSAALDLSRGILGSMAPTRARDIIYQMQISDLQAHPELLKVEQFSSMKARFESMISNKHFGPSETLDTLGKAGYDAHKKVLYYLHEHVVEEADVDF